MLRRSSHVASFATPTALRLNVLLLPKNARTCERRPSGQLCCSRRPRVSAVFLPPSESPYPRAEEGETLSKRISEKRDSDDDPIIPPERNSGSNLDDILKDTSPEYDTWVSRNQRRSLATVRGRSELSLGADELNESLQPGYLDKLRFVLKPDEAFGVIFTWDTVLSNSRELELKAWNVVAEEEGLIPVDMDDILRGEAMAPEAAVQRIFHWTSDWREIKRLVLRKCEVYEQLFLEWQFTKWPGIDAWLEALNQYGITSVICAERPRSRMENTIEQVGLTHCFPSNRLVAVEDEFESAEQMLLMSALKVQRPPSKCVFFTDKPAGITAAREVSSKVVAMIGAHPAYDIKTADMTVANYSDLVLYHVRSLFSQDGTQRMDPETELEVLV